MNLAIILGTNRPGNSSERVADYFLVQLCNRDEIEAKVFKPVNSALQTNGAEQTTDEEFAGLIDWADGVIIVTPEYNHGYPGSLKRLLDSVAKTYIHKSVALVGVSSGSWGGTRAVAGLLPVVRELGMTATFTDMYFPKVKEIIDDQGQVLDEKIEGRTKEFLDELVWMTKTMQWGIENVDSKYHQN